MKKSLAILLIFTLFLIVNSVQAAGLCEPCDGQPCDPDLICEEGKCRGCPTSGLVICNPLQACDVRELIENLINFIFVVAIAIVPIMILVGGFYFLTSGGDPNKVRTAKSIVLWTIVGLVIVLFAKGIISVIKQIIGG